VAKARIISSCHAIAALIEWYRRSHGLKNHPALIGHSSAVALYSLIAEDLHDVQVQHSFHVAANALFAVSRRWSLCRAILRSVWMTICERELKELLPESTRKLLEVGGSDTWQMNDHLYFQSSVYPNYAIASEQGRQLADMGDLLQKWSSLQVEPRPAEQQNVTQA
jgi:hypothetical protein